MDTFKFPDKLVVSVTQEDIDNGKRCECNACPIALAVLRAIGNPVGIACQTFESDFELYVQVGSSFRRGVATYPNSKEVAEWINEFDLGKTAVTVKPFEFEAIEVGAQVSL